MKKKNIKTAEIIVFEQNGVITVISRVMTIFIMSAAGFVLGCILLLAARISIPGMSEIPDLSQWGAYIIIPLSILLFLIGILNSFRNKTVFDCNRGIMGRIGKKYRFNEISGLKLVTTPFIDRKIYAVIAEIKGGNEFKIAGGLDSEILEKIILLINPRIARRISESPAGIEEKTKNRILINWFFIGIFFLVLGAIWSVTGFIFLRDYVYRGLLFWPFGIWLAAFGLFEIAGLPLYKWMKTGPAWLKITLVVVWLGSYLLICRR